MTTATSTNDVLQVQSAVKAAYDPSTPASIQSQAFTYLDSIKKNPTGWQLAWTLFRHPTSNDHVKFFSLQVFEETLLNHPSSFQDLNFIQTQLFRPPYPFLGLPLFLKNKWAQILILILAQHYVSFSSINARTYSSFFDDMLSWVTNEFEVEPIQMVLKICLTLDQELVNPNIHRDEATITRNQLIKDKMREGDVQKLAHAWYTIATHFKSSNIDIVCSCLKCVGLYVAWADASLFVTEPWIHFILSCLSSTSFQLKIASLECLGDIFSKGMKPIEKLHLFQTLPWFDLLQSIASPSTLFPIPSKESIKEEQYLFAETIAKFINHLGTTLVATWQDSTELSLKQETESNLERLFPFYLNFFNFSSDLLVLLLTGFTSEWLQLLKKAFKMQGKLTSQQQSMVSMLLQGFIHKMKYPTSEMPIVFLEEDDEEEDSFLFLRKKLKVFFLIVAQFLFPLWSHYVLSTCHSILDQSLQQVKLDPLKWMESEVCLYFIGLYGEKVKKNTEQVNELKNLIFKVLQTRFIEKCPHPLVQIRFLDIVTKHVALFESSTEFLPIILTCFCDQLQASQPTIRTKAASLFLKFVKQARHQLIPFMEPVLTQLSNVMTLSQTLFNEHVFEAMGCLIALAPPSQRVTYLSNLFTPLLHQLSLSFNASSSPSSSSSSSSSSSLSSTSSSSSSASSLGSTSFNATPGSGVQNGSLTRSTMSSTSTLFSSLSTHTYSSSMTNPLSTSPSSSSSALSPSSSNLLPMRHALIAMKCMCAFLPTLDMDSPETPFLQQSIEYVLNFYQQTQEKAYFLDVVRGVFQSLVQVLGPFIFPYLPTFMESILPYVTLKEGSDVLHFLGLLLFKYKLQVHGFIERFLPTLFHSLWPLLQHQPKGTDDQVFLTDLKRSYLSFLGSLCNAQLDVCLLQSSYVQQVLTSIVTCTSDQERSVQRSAIALLNKLITAWTKHDLTSLPESFYTMLLPLLGRVCFEIPMTTYDAKDAGCSLLFHELASLQKSLVHWSNLRWGLYLSTVYFPQVQCPSSLAQEYVQAVQQFEVKKLQEYLKKFMRMDHG